MLIMLVSAFLVSGIISNEFSWKSDSIFFSTKYGRDRGTRAKIMAGFIVVSVIYFIVISLYSLVVLGCLGSQGGNVMIQTGFWHWKSFYNITYMQLYLLTVVAGYIGTVLVMMFITGYWRIHTNTDLFKDIRPERQALQELLMNLGIIAMWGKKQQRRFIRVECAWKNMWKILNRIKNFEYSILTAEILYPKAETTNVQMELKPLRFGLFSFIAYF